ncbi:protein-glutamate methylesterase/protein-glutamine glutaminase [Paraglaciecola hydrolytica]|uniref:Protein-glutamate methylesterase/protein-glutamine glutaminase n=1 Tax=Paraglaciecola hydrolytica TaxID=1799789 RepID=A0A148KNW7_9ALTE|nr:chemotaxis response regulator protein-glutamate methylesterase [Paraglaciecola hydrolytica]KXI27949.1 chemotaxis response regulator protein-glutamate methylesterase [Paraglaciecola hydrolytica]
MAYRILIVDDSTFFRRRITQILQEDPELQVVGEAKDGMEAINLVKQLKPDVVTMDVEMPVMDGISAVKQIMAQCPVPIIMFSSLTQDGAQATLNALDAGALDFLPKRFEDIALNKKEAVALLQNRVKTLARKNPGLGQRPLARLRESLQPAAEPKPALHSYTSSFTQTNNVNTAARSGLKKSYKCLAIGTSTGGPVALQKILIDLPATFPYPIIMVQHMPAAFTEAFASRLNELCKINIKEAQHGEMLKKGVAYLAPGGRQMTIEGHSGSAHIKISEPEQFPQAAYKPSVDLTFDSLAKVYGGDVLGIILTGMGADGREGCRTLKSRGARIWAQDEKSCVVYGMPQAVTVANISENNFDILQMASQIKAEMLN